MKEEDSQNDDPYILYDKPESHTIKKQSVQKNDKFGKLDMKRKGK